MIQEDHSAMQARHGASLHNRRHTVQYFVQDMPQWTESMMVQAVSYSAFRNNLKSYMRKVNEDADTLMVTNIDPNDNVVVMSVRDYDSLMEMLRIHPHEGIGKPEPLKWMFDGAWSRRIDAANRLIYTVEGERLCILSAKDHYR